MSDCYKSDTFRAFIKRERNEECQGKFHFYRDLIERVINHPFSEEDIIHIKRCKFNSLGIALDAKLSCSPSAKVEGSSAIGTVICLSV